MNAGQILSELLTVRGYTKEYLSKKMGYRFSSGVTEQIRRKSGITVPVLLRFLDHLDCDLVVRSKTDKRVEWLVTAEEEDQ